ncbi:MAG: thermonuclease family protein, partial [Planctomycetota bacterium]
MRIRDVAAALLATGVAAFWAGRLTAPAAPAPAAATSTTVQQTGLFTVTKTVDGDTVHVTQAGMEEVEKVRLLAINTPERGRPWYAEATAALASLVQDKSVQLEPEKPGKLQRDRYGRWLAYIIVDGKNANVEMVR